jgi:hypothetical protein
MNDNTLDIFEDVSNPLDSIEELLSVNDWIFNRPNPEELTVHVSGKLGSYHLTFIWQEEYSAMQFFCEFENLRIPAERMEMTNRALARMNERLWLGHFEVPEETAAPRFRHTSLFRGWTNTSGADHVEDLVDLALIECERHHNIFNMLATSIVLDGRTLDLMLNEEAGEA